MAGRWMRRIVAAAAALVLVGTLAACKVVTAPQTPGAMDVSIEIQRYAQGNTHVTVHFGTPGYNTVEFVSGETVACDGQFLRYSLGSYIGDVSLQGDDGTYTVTYTPAAGTSTGSASPLTVSVKVVPAAVSVSRPASGATVALSAPLTVQYQAAQLANTSVSLVATDARGHFTFTLPQGDSGTAGLSAGQLDGFQAGPGTLSVVRETMVYPSGTVFHSVEVHFKNITQVPITWQ